jgi:hypothetical protein
VKRLMRHPLILQLLAIAAAGLFDGCRDQLAFSLHPEEGNRCRMPSTRKSSSRGTMKVTQVKTVMEIIRPPIEGLPAAPLIGMHEPITQAVELMLNNDKKHLAVAGRCGVIGHVRLEDALRCLGLR